MHINNIMEYFYYYYYHHNKANFLKTTEKDTP